MVNPPAIGYLRKDVSGAHQQWDEAQMRSLAKRLGYRLTKTVTFGAQTDNPLQRLMNVIENVAAEAVLTPSLTHFGGEIPDVLVKAADVITVQPETTYARWIIPPDAPADMGSR